MVVKQAKTKFLQILRPKLRTEAMGALQVSDEKLYDDPGQKRLERQPNTQESSLFYQI
jgi:hypothetical protein